jgi:hypothetical protein
MLYNDFCKGLLIALEVRLLPETQKRQRLEPQLLTFALSITFAVFGCLEGSNRVFRVRVLPDHRKPPDISTKTGFQNQRFEIPQTPINTGFEQPISKLV